MKLTAVRLFIMITKLGLLLLFGASIIITIAILIVDFSNNPTTTLAYQFDYALTELEPAPIEVNCDELYAAYQNDEEAAEVNYKYKRLSLFRYASYRSSQLASMGAGSSSARA